MKLFPLLSGILGVALSASGVVASTDYDKAYWVAVKAGKPLVVYVGQEAKPVDGAIVCRAEKCCGETSACVIIGQPSGDDVVRVATLKGSPEAAEIRQALTPPRTSYYAAPAPSYYSAPASSFRGCSS
jgi:hypothetical protein